jgi:hypothetical protein
LKEIADQPSVQKVGGFIWDTYVEKTKNDSTPPQAKDVVEEAASDEYVARDKPPGNLTGLTAKPHAYHWLYSLQAGENLFEDRKKCQDMVMDYFPEASYANLELTKAHSKEGMAYLFGKVMRPGDVVYAYNDGLKTIEGVGIITGQYEFRANAADGWNHRRKVFWVPRSRCAWPGAQFALFLDPARRDLAGMLQLAAGGVVLGPKAQQHGADDLALQAGRQNDSVEPCAAGDGHGIAFFDAGLLVVG